MRDICEQASGVGCQAAGLCRVGRMGLACAGESVLVDRPECTIGQETAARIEKNG
ncbi:MAG TPA: hypothetical protein PKK68_12910 [Methanothrix soehngenii]|nr:hypothetical protein [Methanothrix soehngenii]